ncbi:UNVERIFIED_CONTAM: hypothetical protein FKN15_050390 [Acipenser sinensis]
MDVLRPSLININGRIYRKNITREQTYQNEEDFDYSGRNDLQITWGLGDIYASPDCLDEPCDTVEVEQTEKGYRCAIDVPSVLYKYIIGKKGDTRKRLETETQTSINIPKQGVEGQIVITGQQRASVISACTRIEVLMESFRMKQPFTHFLSFALNQPEIQERYLQFKEEVLKNCSQDNGVDGSIFQNPAKLHLTIGTLSLLNEKEVTKACELLQQCKEDFIKLQLIADQLVKHFVSSGLMTKEWDRVKLHATVMNTVFRKDPSAEDKRDSGRQGLKDRESFDARNLMKIFGKYHFGNLDLNAVQVSQRFSTDSSGYYTSSGLITFS